MCSESFHFLLFQIPLFGRNDNGREYFNFSVILNISEVSFREDEPNEAVLKACLSADKCHSEVKPKNL